MHERPHKLVLGGWSSADVEAFELKLIADAICTVQLTQLEHAVAFPWVLRKLNSSVARGSQ